MSCGVRYEFSLVSDPKTAKVIVEELQQLGTPHDAVEAGPADPRLSAPGVPLVDDTPRGRSRTSR